MTKTVERTAIADCSLDGVSVKVGQVLNLNRKQFTRLVAAGCIHEDAEENETVPKLSLAGEIGTAIGEAQDGAAIEAGNAAHTGSVGYADSHSALADAARVAAERERREIEARDAAEDARRAAERQRQEEAKIAADAKAKAEAEARVKAEREAKAKADADAKIKAEAEAKAKAEADAKAKAAQTPPGATA